ncbi:MAG TPA: hypothetical protein VF622_17560 [Segetibacter sp.]|jgi:hypothetical protein
MIEENEIIEGCNVLYKDKFFSVKWKQINKVIIRPVDDIGFIETNYDSLEGVVITSEILEKIGFNKIKDDVYSYRDKKEKTYEVDLSDPQKTVFKIDGKSAGLSIVALHQLQKQIYTLSDEACLLKDIEPE